MKSLYALSPRRLSTMGLCGLLAAGALGCPPPSTTMGQELWTRIAETDPYEDWAQFPDAQGTISSAAPHGPLSRVYISTEVEQGMANFTDQLPDGSVIVKESFNEAMEPSGDFITVMWKVPAFDAFSNDWFWAKFDTDGTILAEGQLPSCVACHSIRRNNDYIFLQQF